MKRLSLSMLLVMVLTATGCTQSESQSNISSSSALTSTSATAVTTQQVVQPQVSRHALSKGLYELAYSERQNAVFVASSGSFGEDAEASRILRLDPDTLEVQVEINLERKGFGVALDDEDDRLYVGNALDASITVIDTATNQVIDVVQLAEKVSLPDRDGKVQERYLHSFREMVLDKSNSRLYAPGLAFKDSALYVVDTEKLELEHVIPDFGFLATGITLDTQHHALYVSNLQGQFYTVDTRILAIQNKAEVQGDQLLNLVLDSKHNRVLATDQGEERIDGMRKEMGGLEYQNRSEGNQIVVIEPANGNFSHTIPTGKGPIALLLDEPRDRLYVTNRESGTVTVYDSTSYALLHTVDLPTHPNSLTLNPQNGDVYVTIKNGPDDPKGDNESVARLQF